jgi:hypothetical protein
MPGSERGTAAGSLYFCGGATHAPSRFCPTLLLYVRASVALFSQHSRSAAPILMSVLPPISNDPSLTPS